MNDELQMIIKEAHTLYFKYGIKSVSMDDVAREVSMSKKTLYQHIKDKSELVGKVLEYETETVSCDFSKIFESGSNAIEELIAVNAFIKKMLLEKSFSFEFDLEKYYPAYYKKYKKRKQEETYKSMYNNIEKGKKEGIFRPDVKSEIISGLYVSRVSSSHFFKFLFEEKENFDTLHREIVIYHIRGIANEKGLDILNEKILNGEI